MADMIDANEAKSRLGCDDATLQSYINNGTIRAQRSGGKILCNAEDIETLVGGDAGDDDGTIVLTGDSDDLSIDLGKVVDDSSETIVQSRGGGADDSSITFGDELEVVSFDDSQNTGELVFDDTNATGDAGNLSFTDSNTAVMTAVDETAVGATTAPLDFQTQADGPSPTAGSARRSVRSNRMVMREEEPTHWIWPTLLGLTAAVALFFIIPFYVIAVVPKDGTLSNGNRDLGAQDNGWSNMAGGLAGFTVEPSKARFDKENNGGEWLAIPDDQAQWRYQQFRGDLKEKGDRVMSFVIKEVSVDGLTATSEVGGKTYSVIEVGPTIQGDTEPIRETQVQIWR